MFTICLQIFARKIYNLCNMPKNRPRGSRSAGQKIKVALRHFLNLNPFFVSSVPHFEESCFGMARAHFDCGISRLGSSNQLAFACVGLRKINFITHFVLPHFLFCTYIISHFERFVKGFFELFSTFLRLL